MTQHLRTRETKARCVINTVWSIKKRTLCYGMEVWRLAHTEEIERSQQRFMKMMLLVNPNCPDYIWMVETAIQKMIITTIKHPRSAWRKELNEVLMEAENGKLVTQLHEHVIQKKIQMTMEEVLGSKIEQDIQKIWEIKTVYGIEEYLVVPWYSERQKMLARLRCKGFVKGDRTWMPEEYQLCRVCKLEDETLQHMFTCSEMENVKFLTVWRRRLREGEECCWERLSGSLDVELVKYVMEFEARGWEEEENVQGTHEMDDND
uniref:Uncharacterized protein n=1 Tax=Strigamia maritima TaxID=126957 RepID=T1IUE4_STRMM